ncbi:MAG: hypothetical protein M3Z95_02040 [Actinomycetota bacterium]|nr:hypothetical protein [Actinomycetota bacterium]
MPSSRKPRRKLASLAIRKAIEDQSLARIPVGEVLGALERRALPVKCIAKLISQGLRLGDRLIDLRQTASSILDAHVPMAEAGGDCGGRYFTRGHRFKASMITVPLRIAVGHDVSADAQTPPQTERRSTHSDPMANATNAMHLSRYRTTRRHVSGDAGETPAIRHRRRSAQN